jgi:hypothetical protein
MSHPCSSIGMATLEAARPTSFADCGGPRAPLFPPSSPGLGCASHSLFTTNFPEATPNRCGWTRYDRTTQSSGRAASLPCFTWVCLGLPTTGPGPTPRWNKPDWTVNPIPHHGRRQQRGSGSGNGVHHPNRLPVPPPYFDFQGLGRDMYVHPGTSSPQVPAAVNGPTTRVLSVTLASTRSS